MKLSKLTLRDFRAFPTGKESYEFSLPNGENLLLYGENGSGKTSLYHALRAIFSPARRARDFCDFDFAHFRNVFSSPDNAPATDGHVTVEVSGAVELPDPNDAAKTTQQPQSWPFSWSYGGSHPSANHSDTHFDAIARRATFLDYKALLRIHHAPGMVFPAQLFTLVIEELLREVELGSAGTVYDAWDRLRNPAPSSQEGAEPTEEEKAGLPTPEELWQEAADNFRGQVMGLLEQLTVKASTILNELSPGLTARLVWPETLSINKFGPPHDLVPPVLRLEATCFGRPISEPGPFLNEARLTALALAFYLAAAEYGAPRSEAGKPDYPRLMVLDDVLIGLDLSHRLPLLRVLERAPFDQWQVLLLTHDKAWFDLAQLHTALGSRWRCYELHAKPVQEDLSGVPVSYEVPYVLPPKGEDAAAHYLALAHHALRVPRDERMAGLYARVAFETKLKGYASERNVQVGYKLNPAELKTTDFLDAIERRLKWQGQSIALYAAIQRVRLFLKGVLNPLAHCHPITLHPAEVWAAIEAVEALKLTKDSDRKEENHLASAEKFLPSAVPPSRDQLNLAAVHLRVAFEVSLRAFLKRKAGKVIYRDDWKDLPLSDLWAAAIERLSTESGGPAIVARLDSAAHPVFHDEWTFSFVRSQTEQQLRDALAALKAAPPNAAKTVLDCV